MKGIVLAGGTGSRLHPITKGISKQLLPIYDKPMIYYPISVLMLAGIREILIISTPKDLPFFRILLGSGAEIGVEFFYKEQPSPDGLAQAFILGQEFIGRDDVCLILGDNIFYGSGLSDLLDKAVRDLKEKKKSTIFSYYVHNPESYGIAEFDDDYNLLSVEEKPKNPKSNYAIVGLYFFSNDVINIAKNIKPSKRGELEITSVIEIYMKQKSLKLLLMGRGYAWLDTGTTQNLLEAGNFVEILETRQGLKIACLEEIAFLKKFITKEELLLLGTKMKNNTYGQYLINIAKNS